MVGHSHPYERPRFDFEELLATCRESHPAFVDALLGEIPEALAAVSLADGEVLVSEGEASEFLFILAAGRPWI